MIRSHVVAHSWLPFCQNPITFSSINLDAIQTHALSGRKYEADYHAHHVQQVVCIMAWPTTCKQSKQMCTRVLQIQQDLFSNSIMLKWLICCLVQVVKTPVSREAVLTWLEGVTTASLEDIAESLMAKQQMPALSNILQELQSDFEIATKAGRYFML